MKRPFIMEHAEDFSELEVYQLARQLAKEIFAISKTFSKEETYSLTDQIRRSSRSIGGQIAEAWAKRNYERHFVSKLSDGDGEQLETKHWLFSAWDCQYISDEEASRLLSGYGKVGRMLQSMMNKSHLFCKPLHQKNKFKRTDKP